MSYEVIQKVGRHQYIYLAEGYRNENGQPRQKRRPIGKIDPVTGQKYTSRNTWRSSIETEPSLETWNRKACFLQRTSVNLPCVLMALSIYIGR